MKNYNEYYFFKLRYNFSKSKGYQKYSIEKNILFDNFLALNETLDTLKDIKNKISKYNYNSINDFESFNSFISVSSFEFKSLYNNHLCLNKQLVGIYNKENEDSLNFKKNIAKDPHLFKEIIKARLSNVVNFYENNIKVLEEYITIGKRFLEIEQENALIYFESYIKDNNIETLDFELSQTVFDDKTADRILYSELCNYYKNYYLLRFEQKLILLKEGYINLFHKFKSENVKSVLIELDLLSLEKNKLMIEESTFNSLASSFVLSLIEKFDDTKKNIKIKIALTKRFIHEEINAPKESEKVRKTLESYIYYIFNLNMSQVVSIKKDTFKKFLTKCNINFSGEINKDMTIPYEYLVFIYKDIIENYENKSQFLLYPLEQGKLSSDYKYFSLNREYKTKGRTYYQDMVVTTNNNFKGSLSDYVISREDYQKEYSVSEHKQGIPFNIMFNLIESVYIRPKGVY